MTPANCLSGKQRYPDMGAAREALRMLKRRTGLQHASDLEPYWCSGCGGCHLGRKSRAVRNQQRGRRKATGA